MARVLSPFPDDINTEQKLVIPENGRVGVRYVFYRTHLQQKQKQNSKTNNYRRKYQSSEPQLRTSVRL